MTWAVFVDTDGKPKVDHYAFARLGRLISEHRKEDEAKAALKLYIARQKREELEMQGQGSLFG